MSKVVRLLAATALAFSSLFIASPAQAVEVWWAQVNNEHEQITITAPEGWQFVWGRAWYGDPADWSCGSDVSATFLGLIAGTTTATIAITNDTFTDTCSGIEKVFRFTWGIIPLYYQPTPDPTPEPSTQPTIEPSPEPSPAPTPEPSPAPSPQVIPEVVPSPQPTQEPAPQPAPEPETQPIPEIAPPIMPIEPVPPPSPIDNPIPAPLPPTAPIASIQEPLAPEPLPPVIIPEPTVIEVTSEQLAEEAKADDPVLPQELAAIPLLGDAAVAVLEAFNALGNVGADLTPEVREQAQETIIASVIVSNIATTSVMASAASYRRIK
jgi:hypothetical protein